MLITISLILIGINYPFKPIHLSLMNLITIGVPSFVLAMEPNKERIQGNFLTLVIKRAAPISLTIYTIILMLLLVSDSLPFDNQELSTICVLLNTTIMLIYQYKLCVPFNTIRKVMFGSLTTLFLIEILFFRDFFSLSPLSPELLFMFVLLLILGTLVWSLLNKMYKFCAKYAKKYLRKV